MTERRVFVYGAGGHGKVVADIVLTSGAGELAGFIDDAPDAQGSTVLGFPVVARDLVYREAVTREIAIALGIGDNATRQKIVERCLARGLEILTAIHPTASVSGSATLGAGTVVMAGAVINPCAAVGIAAIINSGAVVEHDVVVGDYAHVSPKAALGGAARLGSMSHLGLGAVVLPGIAIGESTVVGAGSVVIRDLPDRVVAMGVPARVRVNGNKS
ncbi:MAG TPA: acetyltransferase [Blastocatellia bacterium]|nr:acetyltransferase [Blastocatellia bacterium]